MQQKPPLIRSWKLRVRVHGSVQSQWFHQLFGWARFVYNKLYRHYTSSRSYVTTQDDLYDRLFSKQPPTKNEWQETIQRETFKLAFANYDFQNPSLNIKKPSDHVQRSLFPSQCLTFQYGSTRQEHRIVINESLSFQPFSYREFEKLCQLSLEMEPWATLVYERPGRYSIVFTYRLHPSVIQQDTPHIICGMDPGIKTFQFAAFVQPQTGQHYGKAYGEGYAYDFHRYHQDHRQYFHKTNRAFDFAYKPTFFPHIKLKHSMMDLHRKVASSVVRHATQVNIPRFSSKNVLQRGHASVESKEAMLLLGHTTFRRVLKHACQKHGVTMTNVSEVNTTVSCYKCHWKFPHTKKLSDRTFQCQKCSTPIIIDRDYNAALCIAYQQPLITHHNRIDDDGDE